VSLRVQASPTHPHPITTDPAHPNPPSSNRDENSTARRGTIIAEVVPPGDVEGIVASGVEREQVPLGRGFTGLLRGMSWMSSGHSR